jgi:hypothetical protein
MKNRILSIAAVLGLALAGGRIAAGHHSFCAEFDRNKPYSFTGTVSRVEWQNPHVWMYLLVKDEKGVVQEWGVTTASSPYFLERLGWTKDMVKVGDEIFVQGALSKNGSRRGGLGKVVFKGKTLYESSNPAAC